MSSKACEQYYCKCKRHKASRCLFACILALIILILFVILVIWLVLRPTKPRFYLRDVTITQFNLSQPNYLTTSLQVTVSSRNPNDRIGVYYDKLDVYAEYKNQRVTIPTALPTGYQGHNDFAVWSPFLYGTDIPVGPFLTEALSQDENAGFLLIDVKVDGKLRWKVGSWVSGHYHIYVNCPAFFTVGNGKANGGGWGFRFQQMVTCSVDV